MNDEIKEILDRLYGFLYKVQNDFGFEYFTKREIELVFDYITNLQQENKELNRMCELYSKSLYNAELTDYKSRCEKANKFIDNNSHYYSTVKHNEGFSMDLDEEVFCNTLSNILNGSDDND